MTLVRTTTINNTNDEDETLFSPNMDMDEKRMYCWRFIRFSEWQKQNATTSAWKMDSIRNGLDVVQRVRMYDDQCGQCKRLIMHTSHKSPVALCACELCVCVCVCACAHVWTLKLLADYANGALIFRLSIVVSASMANDLNLKTLFWSGPCFYFFHSLSCALSFSLSLFLRTTKKTISFCFRTYNSALPNNRRPLSHSIFNACNRPAKGVLK